MKTVFRACDRKPLEVTFTEWFGVTDDGGSSSPECYKIYFRREKDKKKYIKISMDMLRLIYAPYTEVKEAMEFYDNI
jgi:hypothetical protein